MYKLVAIDLDGTLLNSYGVVSENNKNAIKEALDKGIKVIIASGRVLNSVLELSFELGIDTYAICGNGAIIYDIKNQKIIYDKYMDKEKVLKIIKICEENSIYYNLYTENAIVAKSLNYNVLFYENENKRKPENKKTKINIISDIYKYVLETDYNKYSKITICDEDKVVFNSIIKKIEKIKNIDILDVSSMSRKKIRNGTENVSVEYCYTEITNENVDKWNSLDFLINMLEIKKEEVVAIGDNNNDKLMIQNAGLGISMGNSSPWIKENSNVIVSDNNEDGVAEAFYKYIL